MASASTPSFKSITLAPGQCFVLPKGAVVQSVVTDGAITVTSSCGDLPTPSAYKCGVFYLFAAITSGDGGPMDEENTYYNKITIGGTTYVINEKVIQGDNPGAPTDVTTLNLHVLDTALFEFKGIGLTALSDRQRVAVYFKVPEDLFDNTVLQISDRGTLYNLPANEFDCDSYPAPE